MVLAISTWANILTLDVFEGVAGGGEMLFFSHLQANCGYIGSGLGKRLNCQKSKDWPEMSMGLAENVNTAP